MFLAWLTQRALFSWCTPPLWLLYTFCLFARFPEFLGEKFDGDLPFNLCHLIMSDCEPLHLFPPVTGGSLSDDDRIRHWSMRRTEYHVFVSSFIFVFSWISLGNLSIFSLRISIIFIYLFGFKAFILCFSYVGIFKACCGRIARLQWGHPPGCYWLWFYAHISASEFEIIIGLRVDFFLLDVCFVCLCVFVCRIVCMWVECVCRMYVCLYLCI